jgi:hypothetical protein
MNIEGKEERKKELRKEKKVTKKEKEREITYLTSDNYVSE